MRLTTGRTPTDAEVANDRKLISDLREKHGLSEDAALAQYCLLCINANEAMPHGGQLQVHARNTTLDTARAEPLAGETRYFLHFGDLSNPARDVIWTSPSTGHPIQAEVPATRSGRMPFSSSTWMTPMCEKPRAAPPPSASMSCTVSTKRCASARTAPVPTMTWSASASPRRSAPGAPDPTPCVRR